MLVVSITTIIVMATAAPRLTPRSLETSPIRGAGAIIVMAPAVVMMTSDIRTNHR